MARPRVLIEDWLPAAALGVECMRERGSASALAPTTFLHVWWARRPLAVSRAAVLGSLLPADFPRETFERLLGFWGPSTHLVAAQQLLDWSKANGQKIPNPHGDRAFRAPLRDKDLGAAHRAARVVWGEDITILDPMAGGGSIPLESARLGFYTLANEYNPVACSVLEATIDYPFRFGAQLAERTRSWGAELRRRFNKRMERYYRADGVIPPLCYIFARTVPCPDTQHPTPLVSDWHLLKPKSGIAVVAEPLIDKAKGTWSVRIRELGNGRGQLSSAPKPTYRKGSGISLFDNKGAIPADYIKAMAQAGKMDSALYAVALKTPQGLKFRPAEVADLKALAEAETECRRQRPAWEQANIIPTEEYPEISSDPRPRLYGMPRWADMFSLRQLLCFGTVVDELRALRPEIIAAEGSEVGEAILQLLAFGIDKFANYNTMLSSWHVTHQVIRGIFDRHDFSFKTTFTEMAPCGAGTGLDWAIGNACEAYQNISNLPRTDSASPVDVSFSSATSLPQLADASITTVVVDPPYAGNVQYSELADFFYVWLKRTQGHRRPEWFSSYLTERDQEAVVNVARHRKPGEAAKVAKARAHVFYQRLMTDTFRECRRVLRDDGVLTVMFTHKQQEAWESLFQSLIEAGFNITATWPVKTESEHSLHQAKKNAAQSTVVLVSRKRKPRAGIGYFDAALKQEIRDRASAAAERLKGEGLNPVDQLVGSFGPAMEVFSRYDEVRTDTGEPVKVNKAIDEAADAVSAWRIEQLAARGLDGVEAEGRFYLLCWDVLGAAEFRFNEAKLLGHAVGMDVDQLIAAGLVSKSGDKIKMLSARERRRERALEPDEAVETLFGQMRVSKKRKKGDVLKVHPNDPEFRTVLDLCHALALRYIEAGAGAAGIGSARALANRQRLTKDAAAARLMAALIQAAPEAVRRERGKKSAAGLYPEFRAWHALLKPLFGIEPPDWAEKKPPQAELFEGLGLVVAEAAEDEAEWDDEEEEDGEREDEDET